MFVSEKMIGPALEKCPMMHDAYPFPDTQLEPNGKQGLFGAMSTESRLERFCGENLKSHSLASKRWKVGVRLSTPSTQCSTVNTARVIFLHRYVT
jgi:hypothetical protein